MNAYNKIQKHNIYIYTAISTLCSYLHLYYINYFTYAIRPLSLLYSYAFYRKYRKRSKQIA